MRAELVEPDSLHERELLGHTSPNYLKISNKVQSFIGSHVIVLWLMDNVISFTIDSQHCYPDVTWPAEASTIVVFTALQFLFCKK